MKIKLFSLSVIIALLLVALSPGSVFAGAYATSFTTSITYQNVGQSKTTTLEILFYDSPTDTTPIPITRPNLAPGAGTSVFIGSLDKVGSGFQGTAIMQSDQPLLATLVQVPDTSQTAVLNRPLSNGFSQGSPGAQIATVLKNTFDSNTIFSTQNVGSSETTVKVKFYNTNAQKVHEVSKNLKPGAGYYIDAGAVSQLGPTFNGSAVIESGGSIVASAMELNIGGSGASAFEGVGSGAKKYYMPSALCDAFGGQRTAYAIQNTSLTTSTTVNVQYSNGKKQSAKIGPGAKSSFVACKATGMPTGFSGAAIVESTTTNIIAMGKAYGGGLSTAFIGESQGASKVALPYVRWATNTDWAAGPASPYSQRVFITVQNIGNTTLAAGTVKVKYVDRDGKTVATHKLGGLAPGAKLNSNAYKAGLSSFGYYYPGFGGGAIIEGPSGSKLAVVARVSTQVSSGFLVGEDFNGLPVP